MLRILWELLMPWICQSLRTLGKKHSWLWFLHKFHAFATSSRSVPWKAGSHLAQFVPCSPLYKVCGTSECGAVIYLYELCQEKTKQKNLWILVCSFQLAPFPKSPVSHLFSVFAVSFISSFPFPASHQFVVVLTIFNFRSLQNPFYICSDSCHFCQISSRISSLLVVLVLLLVVLLLVVVAFRTDLLLFLFGFIQSFSLNLFISVNFPVLRLNCFLLFYF